MKQAKKGFLVTNVTFELCDGHEKQSRRRNNSKRVEPKYEKKGKRETKRRKRIEKERGGRRAREKEEKPLVRRKGRKAKNTRKNWKRNEEILKTYDRNLNVSKNPKTSS